MCYSGMFDVRMYQSQIYIFSSVKFLPRSWHNYATIVSELCHERGSALPCTWQKFYKGANELSYIIGGNLRFECYRIYPDILACFNAFKHPAHIISKNTHCLHSLFIFQSLLRVRPVYHVPVVRRDYGHTSYSKIFIQLVKSGRGAPASATYNSGSRLINKVRCAKIESSVHKRGYSTRRRSKVYGRTKYESVKF